MFDRRCGPLPALAFLILCLLFLNAVPADASGIATHMFHAQIGAENVRDPDLAWLLDRYRDAWISGASYPDGGYPLEAGWAEPSHWAPFASAYLEIIKGECEDRYLTNDHCAELVAHFMGAVGHGFEDQVVDALLMPKIQEMDGDDEPADAFIDFFVLHDFDRSTFVPEIWYVPYRELLDVYEVMGIEVNIFDLYLGAALIGWGNVGERWILPFIYPLARETLPWAEENYYTYRGGVEYIGLATAKLFDYYWNRLNGIPGINEEAILPFPENGAVDVVPNRPDTDTHIGVVLDRPFVPSSVNHNTFRVADEFGQPVDGSFTLRVDDPTSDVPISHMIRFSPKRTEPLMEYTRYSVTITPGVLSELGAPLVDEDGFSWSFTTGAAAAQHISKDRPQRLAERGIAVNESR